MYKRRTALLVTFFVLFSLLACNVVNVDFGRETLRGSGDVITETRQVAGFDRISLSGIGELTLTLGDQESLEVEAEDNFMEYIQTEVRGSTLHIGIDAPPTTNFQPTRTIKYRLTMKEIVGIEVSGAGDIKAGEIVTTDLDVESSGAGNVVIDTLEAEFLSISLSGAGDLDIRGGEVSRQKVDISGAGTYKASDLECQVADVLISGAGRATLWVTETLDVDISGVGSLEYYGQPTVTQDVSGVGSVKSLGDR